jgi:hypothetical protein
MQILDSEIYQHRAQCDTRPSSSPFYPELAPRKRAPVTSRGQAGGRAETAKSDARMASPVGHIEQLERSLLRRGLGALEADRDRCVDCGRTPLTGEHVHLYDGRSHGIVCELCRALRREAPVASEIVRHAEHGQTVRLTVDAS